MICILKCNNEADTALQFVCRQVVELKILALLESGLPNNWDEILLAPVLSQKELSVERDRIRAACGRDQLEPSDPDYRKNNQLCNPCPMFNPGQYSITWMLCEKGDALLYPSEQDRDEFDRLFECLTDALALTAFIPCGVPEFWNYSYEAKFDEI